MNFKGALELAGNELKKRPAALLQTDMFDFNSANNQVDRNLLICGENLGVIQYLYNTRGSFIDLIYIDPPFCSDRNYSSPIEGQNFEDKWQDGLRSYLPWLLERVLKMKKLLKNNGSFLIHLDWHAVHYVKVELDKIFGVKNFINEIIWSYQGTLYWKTLQWLQLGRLIYVNKSALKLSLI